MRKLAIISLLVTLIFGFATLGWGLVMLPEPVLILFKVLAVLCFVLLLIVLLIWLLLRKKKGLKEKKIIISKLQYECSQLSRDILQFLTDRKRTAPSIMPRKEQYEAQMNGHIRYMEETVSLYHQRYGSRVVAVYESLKGIGYIDSELDQLYQHPTNENGIRVVGQRLGALAEQLAQSQLLNDVTWFIL